MKQECISEVEAIEENSVLRLTLLSMASEHGPKFCPVVHFTYFSSVGIFGLYLVCN